MKMNLLLSLCFVCMVRCKSVSTGNSNIHDNLKTRCFDEDKHTPHETKCNLYYRCVYGRKVVKECKSGMLFNPQIENCDNSYNVRCGVLETNEDDNEYYGDFSDYYMIDEVTTREPPGTEGQAVSVNNDCPVKEDPYEPNPLLPHEESCNFYYKCIEGKKYLMKCPGILQFNAKVSACDFPRRVRCVDRRMLSSSLSSSTSTTPTSLNE